MEDKAELGGRWGLTDFRSRVTLLLSDNEGCLYLCFFGTRQLMPRDRPWLSSREENTEICILESDHFTCTFQRKTTLYAIFSRSFKTKQYSYQDYIFFGWGERNMKPSTERRQSLNGRSWEHTFPMERVEKWNPISRLPISWQWAGVLHCL